MLTIQILDGGDTFLRELDATGLTFGASETADVRLSENGVAPLHARIEPVDARDLDRGFKIVDLAAADGGDAVTLVNDEPVAQWRIRLGDRIELGRAVLVVGKKVERAATPSDVLERRRPAPVVSRRSRAERSQSASKSSRAVLVGAVLVGLGVLFGLWRAAASDHTVPSNGASRIERLVRSGEFQAARESVASLRDWAGDVSERRGALDALGQHIDAVETAVSAGRTRLRKEAAVQTRSEQLLALKATRDQKPESAAGAAARLLLSELDELRAGVSRVVVTADPNTATDAALTPSASPAVALRRRFEDGDAIGVLAGIREAIDQARDPYHVRDLESLRTEVQQLSLIHISEPTRPY